MVDVDLRAKYSVGLPPARRLSAALPSLMVPHFALAAWRSQASVTTLFCSGVLALQSAWHVCLSVSVDGCIQPLEQPVAILLIAATVLEVRCQVVLSSFSDRPELDLLDCSGNGSPGRLLRGSLSLASFSPVVIWDHRATCAPTYGKAHSPQKCVRPQVQRGPRHNDVAVEDPTTDSQEAHQPDVAPPTERRVQQEARHESGSPPRPW